MGEFVFSVWRAEQKKLQQNRLNEKARKRYHERKTEGWVPPKKKAPYTAQRKKSYQYLYGITIEEFELLHEAQDGVCKICGNPPTRRYLSVDHCHATNKVRGLLCQECNVGLARFKDNPELMERAIKYLKGEL